MYPISIFDSGLTIKGIIDNYQYLKWNFKYRKVDNFEFTVNRYKKNVDLLQEGNIVAVYINGAYSAGIIELKELTLTGEGKISEDYHILGRGLDGLLAERTALYNTDSGDGYDSQSDIAETVMRHYVDVNCISSSDSNRNYNLLELEADQIRGSAVKYDARFQYLSELLEELSLASGLGWGVVLDSKNKKLKFRIYQGTDRSWENGVNSPVIFSPEFGNIELLGFRESRINSKNVNYVGGQGEAAARTVIEVSKNGDNFTDINRREFFTDARDLDAVDKLQQRGNERLEEAGEKIVLEMENLSTGPFEYGIDFHLGDIVTTRYPDIVEMNARVIESILEITAGEGISNKLVIGRNYPDLISLLTMDINKNINPEIRR